MEQMTNEEAIKAIKDNYPKSGYYILRDALDIAIKDIEKQIPVQKHKYMGYRCICGKEVAKAQDYCEYCGQKLLPWNEVK